MRNHLLLISLSLLLAACATGAGDGNFGRSHLKSDLRVDGYYESRRVNDDGEQLFLRFYNGAQAEFSGDKRVKVLLSQPGVPNFSGENAFDTRFTVSSYRTISYQAIHQRQQYSAVNDMADFGFMPDGKATEGRAKKTEKDVPKRSDQAPRFGRPGDVMLENF